MSKKGRTFGEDLLLAVAPTVVDGLMPPLRAFGRRCWKLLTAPPVAPTPTARKPRTGR